jgi:apolipoprotein N-acyltransferase
MTKKEFLLIFLSSLLFALSFPPLKLGFLGYFCLVPLLFVLLKKRGFNALLVGLVWGFLSNLFSLYWIAWVTILGTIGALLALTIYGGIFSWLFSLLTKKWGEKAVFIFPFYILLWEYYKSLGQLAFPWLNLAYTQTYYLKLIQYASITGVWGVSFWVAWLNVLIYLAVKNFYHTKKLISIFALLVLLFILPYIYGSMVLPKEEIKGDVKLALLQGSIEPDVKWDENLLDYNFLVYFELAKKVPKDVDLIIWPETAAPMFLLAEPVYLKKVQGLTDTLNRPMLVGTQDYKVLGAGKYAFYNSAAYFQPQLPYGPVYNKIHLVPFSEWLPFSDKFAILNQIKFGQSDFSCGDELTLFHHSKGDFGVLICFESVFPNLVRQFINQGARYMVIITNDGWFGKTSGPFQHAQIAVFRAIENRTSLARCANTGVSMFIDPYGRTKSKTKIFVRENLIGEVSLKKETTFYTKNGDWLAMGCSVLALLFLILALPQLRKH